MKLDNWKSSIDRIPLGKRLPKALYIHRDALEEALPADLLQEVRRAQDAGSPSSGWNLIKLHTDQQAATFLSYPDFDSDPHPALAEATKITLTTGRVVHTDYRKRSNPPILHRKETFLAANDPRQEMFAQLTEAEEDAGLYKEPSRIGNRAHWLSLLRQYRLTHEGHRLVRLPSPIESSSGFAHSTNQQVERHRTAIKRYDLSRPVKILLGKGLLTRSDRFFDYGCGHGMDIEALTGLGYNASGWDPAFRPDAALEEAEVVNHGYVLNVIEEPSERSDALRGAFRIATRVLVISTFIAGQESPAHSRPYRDGYLTKSNTFQKFFTPNELEKLIVSTLDREPIPVGLGIYLVFRSQSDAEKYESSRRRRRIDWSDLATQLRFTQPSTRKTRLASKYELHRAVFDSFWQCLLDLGRLPEPWEFDQMAELRMAAGGLQRAFKLVLERNKPQLWEVARDARREDTLVYMAMTHFRKRFLQRDIPLRTRQDIKAFFGDYQKALAASKDVLFAAGDPDEVELAVESLDFGHLDRKEMHFTFHRSKLDQLPAILRVFVYCGAIRYGDPEEADLIKIHVRSGKLTFLHYDDFERKSAPQLQTRIKINLRTQFVQVFDHKDENSLLENKSHYFNS